jgi:hypothetical protein
MSKTDDTVFHRTRPDQEGSYDQFRLVPSGAGELVIREHVVRAGTGHTFVADTEQWEIGTFLIGDVLPPAKNALQKVLDDRHTFARGTDGSI